MTERVPYLASRLQGLGTTIFAEMSALAAQHGAINLGQGFPDTDGPTVVADAAGDGVQGLANIRRGVGDLQDVAGGMRLDNLIKVDLGAMHLR